MQRHNNYRQPTTRQLNSPRHLDRSYQHICLYYTTDTRIDMTSARDDDVTAAAAARYRLRQMVRQHPPHDSDVRHSTSLRSNAEKDELVKFDRQRRLRDLGRGRFFTVSNDNVNCNIRCRQVGQLHRSPTCYECMCQ